MPGFWRASEGFALIEFSRRRGWLSRRLGGRRCSREGGSRLDRSVENVRGGNVFLTLGMHR